MDDTARTPGHNFPAEPIAFDERTRRLMELRKQVREGTYRPDAEQVARAMLREWAQLGDTAGPRETLIAVETACDRMKAAERFVVHQSEDLDSPNEAVLSA